VCWRENGTLQLIVEQSEILTQVKAQFRFERDGAITKSTHVPITLTVDNGSQATIRFPQRGAMMEGISLEIVRKSLFSTPHCSFHGKN